MLVDRCTDGDCTATRALFRQYHTKVHATLYRILGSNRDLDDLIQESFIQVFKSLSGYRGEAKLSTWIDRITVRVAYRYIRGRQRQPLAFGDMHELQMPAAESGSQVASREGVRRLYAAMSKLPTALRIAFALHQIDGRTISEVATLVGASHAATKLRVWRGRRAIFKLAAQDPVLREFLMDEEGEKQCN